MLCIYTCQGVTSCFDLVCALCSGVNMMDFNVEVSILTMGVEVTAHKSGVG